MIVLYFPVYYHIAFRVEHYYLWLDIVAAEIIVLILFALLCTNKP